MSLLQEVIEKSIGEQAALPTDVKKVVASVEILGARVSGLMAGKSDAVHNRDFSPPNPPGNLVSWAEQRVAYVQALDAVQEEQEQIR